MRDIMAELTKIEDVAKITGMEQYVAALALTPSQLSYTGFIRDAANQAILNFKYQVSPTEIVMLKLGISRHHEFTYFYCSCPSFHKDRLCPHIALAVKHILEHPEFMLDVIGTLPEMRDASFNRQLIEAATDFEKTEVALEVLLRRGYDYCREPYFQLQLRIGITQKYMLNQKLPLFLNHYKEDDFEMSFGKNFIYRASEHCIRAIDQPILDFLKIYESQYMADYDRLGTSQITLKGELLNIFLALLRNHSFALQLGYVPDYYEKIESQLPLGMELEIENGDVLLRYPKLEVTALTDDNQFVIFEGKVYELSNKQAKLLKLLLSREQRKVLFNETEAEVFISQVYPQLKQLDQSLKVADSLQEHVLDERPEERFYIECNDEKLIATIQLCYAPLKLNICSSDYRVGDYFVTRYPDMEARYKEALLQYGFLEDKTNQCFVLYRDEDIAEFLYTGLNDLCNRYHVYVSKEVKAKKMLSKTRVTSQFQLGRDNILSYQFSIVGIDPDELSHIVGAIRDHKKYYHLKNGNYLSLKNSELQAFVSLLDELDVTDRDMKAGQKNVPSYQVVALESQIQDQEFVTLGQPVEALLKQFHEYRYLPVVIDPEDQAILRDYQCLGVKWMKMLSNCGFGGILADEMGLGKSLQTIEYIKLQLKEDPTAKFLIVVPTSLIYNWENEFKKFAPTMKYQVVSDNKANRIKILEHIDDANVLITTYGLLRQDIAYYEDLHFHTCIIDEAQNIKNITTQNTRSVKQIIARTKFALTGTPIENSILELWSIFDFVMPGFLKSSTVFKEKYSTKRLEEDPSVLDILKQQISPFILRRKKSDVLKDLPNKIENTVYVELADEQKALYLAYLEKTKREIDHVMKEEGFGKSQILILSLLTKLRQICIEPRLLSDTYTGCNAKLTQLIDMVSQVIENGHKVLLFSQFPSALQYVKKAFDDHHITYYYLDGSTKSKDRMQLVNDFNNDATNVFLISLKAGGTGLNLTSADVVIHLDPWWNPQVENQATDRTHRIGQKNVVEVIKIITKGTIEEKILELQEKKKRLSDQVIEGESRSELVLSKLSEAELKELLEII